jgi:hypothetical protein
VIFSVHFSCCFYVSPSSSDILHNSLFWSAIKLYCFLERKDQVICNLVGVCGLVYRCASANGYFHLYKIQVYTHTEQLVQCCGVQTLV